MKRRILAFLLSAYVAGVAVSAIAGDGVYFLMVCLLAAGVLYSLKADRRQLRQGLCMVLVFLVGSTQFLACRLDRDRFVEQFAEGDVQVYGKAKQLPQKKNEYWVVNVGAEQIQKDGLSYKEKREITLYFKQMPAIQMGQRMIVTCTLLAPSGARNYDGFDFSQYLRSKNIVATAFVNQEDMRLLDTRQGLFDRLRLISVAVGQKIGAFVPGEGGDFLKGILLGDTSGFSQEMRSAFSASGISHIVAVSGMHVSILAAFLIFLVRKAGGRRKLRMAAAGVGVLAYMAITGFTPSVTRAGIMSLMMMLAVLLDKKEDFWTSLLVAASVILLVNPYSIYNTGFLLSFSATAGIMLFAKPLSGLLAKKLPKTTADTIAVSVAAVIATTPVTAAVFHSVSVLGILTNILVIPFVELLFVGTLVMLGAGACFAQLGAGLGFLLGYLADIVLIIARTVAKIPFARLTVAAPSVVHFALYALLAVLLWRWLHQKKNSRLLGVATGALCGICILLWAVTLGNFNVTFLNVGQGDSILISAPYFKHYLIDTGRKGNQEVLQYLKSRGIWKIDTLFLTHSDDDHSGGLEGILENMRVDKVVLPEIHFYSQGDQACRNAARAAGVPVEYADRNFAYRMGPAEVDVVWPDEETIKKNEDNNNCLGMWMEYKGHRFLFTGDMEQEAEAALLQTQEPLGADVLKISHHGSKYGTGKEFLAKVSPKYAVISVGKNNYGHPAPETVERLQEENCDILRTDKNGTISFVIEPSGVMRLKTFQ